MCTIAVVVILAELCKLSCDGYISLFHLNVSLLSLRQDTDISAENHKPYEIQFHASSTRLFEQVDTRSDPIKNVSASTCYA